MNAEELRIGNWYRLEGGKDYILSLDNWMDILASYRNDEFLKGTNIEWMSGVPITPTWLERLGFEKDEQKISNCDVYKKGFYKIHVNQFGIIYFSHYTMGGFYLTELKHIHQLQNLYFALTSEELKQKE